MPTIIVTTRDERIIPVKARIGNSLMEAIRDADVHELLALCGGSCSCATCHVYVAPAQEHKLPPIEEDEDDMLSGSEYRKETSRLSCQLEVSQEFDGLEVKIAPEE